ncbi:hypothetical protein QTN25_010232 [Entamoeba marina]
MSELDKIEEFIQLNETDLKTMDCLSIFLKAIYEMGQTDNHLVNESVQKCLGLLNNLFPIKDISITSKFPYLTTTTNFTNFDKKMLNEHLSDLTEKEKSLFMEKANLMIKNKKQSYVICELFAELRKYRTTNEQRSKEAVSSEMNLAKKCRVYAECIQNPKLESEMKSLYLLKDIANHSLSQKQTSKRPSIFANDLEIEKSVEKRMSEIEMVKDKPKLNPSRTTGDIKEIIDEIKFERSAQSNIVSNSYDGLKNECIMVKRKYDDLLMNVEQLKNYIKEKQNVIRKQKNINETTQEQKDMEKTRIELIGIILNNNEYYTNYLEHQLLLNSDIFKLDNDQMTVYCREVTEEYLMLSNLCTELTQRLDTLTEIEKNFKDNKKEITDEEIKKTYLIEIDEFLEYRVAKMLYDDIRGIEEVIKRKSTVDVKPRQSERFSRIEKTRKSILSRQNSKLDKSEYVEDYACQEIVDAIKELQTTVVKEKDLYSNLKKKKLLNCLKVFHHKKKLSETHPTNTQKYPLEDNMIEQLPFVQANEVFEDLKFLLKEIKKKKGIVEEFKNNVQNYKIMDEVPENYRNTLLEDDDQQQNEQKQQRINNHTKNKETDEQFNVMVEAFSLQVENERKNAKELVDKCREAMMNCRPSQRFKKKKLENYHKTCNLTPKEKYVKLKYEYLKLSQKQVRVAESLERWEDEIRRDVNGSFLFLDYGIIEEHNDLSQEVAFYETLLDKNKDIEMLCESEGESESDDNSSSNDYDESGSEFSSTEDTDDELIEKKEFHKIEMVDSDSQLTPSISDLSRRSSIFMTPQKQNELATIIRNDKPLAQRQLSFKNVFDHTPRQSEFGIQFYDEKTPTISEEDDDDEYPPNVLLHYQKTIPLNESSSTETINLSQIEIREELLSNLQQVQQMLRNDEMSLEQKDSLKKYLTEAHELVVDILKNLN